MQNVQKSELTERFVELAEHLNRQMHAGRLDEWEAMDMTIPQIKTLVLLKRTGPLRMGNISVYLGRALSATTTVVDRLVEKGLVGRVSDPSDRRVVICELTESGHQAVEAFWRIGRERLQSVVDRMAGEDLEIVVQAFQLLRDVTEQIEQESAELEAAE